MIGGGSAVVAGVSCLAARCQEKFGFTRLKSLDERFVIKSTLGEGGQAKVYKALDKQSQRLVAIKVTPKDHPDGHDLFFAEMDLMTAIGAHHNLTSMQDACETDTAWILVMDLADGGALFEHIINSGKPINEDEASDYILQVAEALMHMHRRGLVHGDVKPENLLLCSSKSDKNASIKLCDFGMARRLDGHDSFDFPYTCGTFDYWAPEVVRKKPCTTAIDMWALGVVAYIMLCGNNPFDPTFEASDAEILSNIARAEIDKANPAWIHLSPECRDLISGLLCDDVDARLTSSNVLEHPWIVQQQTTASLPAVQRQKLRGFQALGQLRAAVAKLNLRADTLFDARLDASTGSELNPAQLRHLFDLIGVSLSPDALEAVREIADRDGNGTISRAEFVHMLRFKEDEKQKAMPDKDIHCLFKIFDQNHDGKISAQELCSVFGLLGRNMSDAQAKLIIQKATGGREDTLSFFEFARLLKQDAGVLDE